MSTGNPIKRSIKRGMQSISARFGPHTRQPKVPQLLILMYHRILPLEDERVTVEEPGMVVSPATFKEHLTAISRYFEFVTLSDWLDRRSKGLSLPIKACAITFDDGWADNYEFAFPVLQTLQVPATIFLVADMIGSAKQFWPERLARLARTISLQSPDKWSEPTIQWLRTATTDFDFTNQPPTTEQISQLVAHAKQFTDEEVQQRLESAEAIFNLTASPSKPSLLDWQQMTAMVDTGLVEAGSHTCNHIRLNDNVSNVIIEHEIIGSKHTIEQRIGRTVKTFCFPNGDYSEHALKLVRDNYQGAVTTASGWNTIHTDGYLLNRIGIHQDISADQTAFLARVSGWI